MAQMVGTYRTIPGFKITTETTREDVEKLTKKQLVEFAKRNRTILSGHRVKSTMVDHVWWMVEREVRFRRDLEKLRRSEERERRAKLRDVVYDQ